jgi:hypothetical protein
MVAWNTQIFIFGWCENFLMGISYYNNLFFNGSMELHVAEIIIILLDVVKQHVRFILFFYSRKIEHEMHLYFIPVLFENFKDRVLQDPTLI